MKNLTSLVGFAFLSTVLFSCAKESPKENLKEAQLCLNTAPASAARDCVAKISTDYSQAAYKLKCAAVFISEGVTVLTFTEALDKLKNTGTCTGGCSSTVTAISTLNFHSGSNLSTDAAERAANVATSVEAFALCSLSGAKIYTDISSLFRIGTEIAMLAYLSTGGAAPTEDQMKAAVASMSDATAGSIVTATYNSSCVNSTSESESLKKYCDELGVSMNSGSTTASIGSCFKNKLVNPSFVCP